MTGGQVKTLIKYYVRLKENIGHGFQRYKVTDS